MKKITEFGKECFTKSKALFFKISGIDDVKNSPEYSEKKLMKGNLFLGSKKVQRTLYIGITVVVLLAINILGQFLSNLGNMATGKMNPFVFFLPSAKLLPFYLVGLVISLVLCIMVYFKVIVNFKELNVGQKGTARWLTKAEVAQRFKKIKNKDESFKGYGGVPVLRDGDYYYIDDSCANATILAITRAGKSESIIVPTIENMARAEKKTSMIIPDVKGTLTTATYAHLIKHGYSVYILDFFDLENTNGYSPLQTIYDYFCLNDIDTAEEISKSLVIQIFPQVGNEAPIWVNGPRAFLEACIFALCDEAQKQNKLITFYGTYLFISELSTKCGDDEAKIKNILDEYFLSFSLTHPARLAYTAITLAEGQTRASLFTVAMTGLDDLRRGKIGKITSKSDFSLTELGFGEKPTAVFIRLPSHKHDYDLLVTTFLSQSYYLNMDRAAKETHNKLPRRVCVIGDEFFNFPADPELHHNISVCVGAGWFYLLVAQSLTQPEKEYGKEEAQIILDNCANTFFLASPDKDTRETISERCGMITVENVTRSGERLSLNKTITEQYEERRLMTPDMLRELKDGEMIVIPSMQRRSLKGEKVTPYPIYAHDESAFGYRYEFLQELDPDRDIDYSLIPSITKGKVASIELESLIISPTVPEETPATEEQRQNKKAVIDTVLEETANIQEDNSEILGNLLVPTEEMFFRNFLPPNFEIDFNHITINGFNELIKTLLSQSEIDSKQFQSLLEMTKQKGG